MTKKNLTALVRSMLKEGESSLVNDEAGWQGDPDAMEHDVQLAREVVLEVLRRTPLTEINKIAKNRRLYFNHEVGV